MDDKYAKVIVQSDNIDDLITSVGIAKSFTTIQDNLIIEFFERIEQGITLKMGNLKVVDDTQDIKNHWKMFQNKHFFGDVFSGDKYTSGNPCTCFEVTGTNYRIYIHIENRVWAELHDGQSRNGDWIYLPTGGPKKTENIPNYFTMNNAAIALHDSEKMDRFIDESIKVIKSKLLCQLVREV